jgi:hypothetical protein
MKQELCNPTSDAGLACPVFDECHGAVTLLHRVSRLIDRLKVTGGNTNLRSMLKRFEQPFQAVIRHGVIAGGYVQILTACTLKTVIPTAGSSRSGGLKNHNSRIVLELPEKLPGTIFRITVTDD